MKEDALSTTNPGLFAAALAAAGGLPNFGMSRDDRKRMEADNKARCVECLCKIPRGRAGRKCKACR